VADAVARSLLCRAAMLRTLSLSLVIALSLAACGKDDKDKAAGGGGTTGASAPGKAAKAPAIEWIKLGPVGLQAEAPAGSNVMDTSVDAPGVMVSGDRCAFIVSTVTEAHPSTYDAEKNETQKFTDGFKSFSKDEQFEGGWHFEYEGLSAIDQKPLYGVQVRVTVGGKQYACGRNDGDKAVIDCAARACRSLKPA
jgi:hypothetical protein